SFTASGPCTVAGATLTATGAGDCVVTASQAGNAHFAPAPDVVRHVTVNQAATALDHARVSLVESLLTQRIRYTAVLTSAGQGLSGQRIASGLARGPAATCTGTTDVAGRATCTARFPGLLPLLVAGATTARFAGSADYKPSTDTAPLRL